MRRPDDNYSPPIDGLTRGKKLHQILTELGRSDTVRESMRSPSEDTNAIVAFVPVSEMAVAPEQISGTLMANWWHVPLEDDWWKYSYYEFDMEKMERILDENLEREDAEEEYAEEEDAEERAAGGLELQPNVGIAEYVCHWRRQENDEVSGETYFTELTPEGVSHEPFEPPAESPRPLTRAITDSLLPEQLRQRHGN